jgi:hypothetical protein
MAGVSSTTVRAVSFGLAKKESNYQPKFRSPTHIALLEGPEFESFELSVRPFSAPRDDTACANCRNGAKSKILL